MALNISCALSVHINSAVVKIRRSWGGDITAGILVYDRVRYEVKTVHATYTKRPKTSVSDKGHTQSRTGVAGECGAWGAK